MLNRFTNILENLVVFGNNMIKNINKTNVVIFLQRVITKLIDKGLIGEEDYI